MYIPSRARSIYIYIKNEVNSFLNHNGVAFFQYFTWKQKIAFLGLTLFLFLFIGNFILRYFFRGIGSPLRIATINLDMETAREF